MRRRQGIGLPLGVLGVAVVALFLGSRPLGWATPAVPERGPDAPRAEAPDSAPAELPEVHLLTEEGIRFYSLGRYPDACQRFSDAADREPGNPVLRENVARCFGGWGWQTLREGRPQEAGMLFGQGLRLDPESSHLLTGLALSAIHAGRPTEALEPLERAVRLSPDPEATLLLARLYDQQERTDRALAHLVRLLERDPSHPQGLRLFRKLRRERRAEAGYWREETPHFVVKHRGPRGREARRLLLETPEEVRAAVGRTFRFFPGQKITVILYPDERFGEVADTHPWAGGIFDGKIRLPMGSLGGRGRAFRQLLTHEYTHAVVHLLSRGRAPRWLQEGLAQHVEGAPGDPDLHLPGALTLAGLEALLTDGDLAKASAGYRISLRVVRDLVERGGMEGVRELLVRLGGGEPLREALAEVYGLPLAALEGQWHGLSGG